MKGTSVGGEGGRRRLVSELGHVVLHDNSGLSLCLMPDSFAVNKSSLHMSEEEEEDFGGPNAGHSSGVGSDSVFSYHR